MFRKLAFTAALAASTFAMPAQAQSSPVVGTWATAIDVQGTKIESTWIVSQANGAYTVEIKDGPMPGAPEGAPPLPSVISDVVVDGAKLSFKRALTLEQGPMNLTYATTVNGDALSGEINSDFGPIPVTGTRT
jgi:hypothetical protein